MLQKRQNAVLGPCGCSIFSCFIERDVILQDGYRALRKVQVCIALQILTTCYIYSWFESSVSMLLVSSEYLINLLWTNIIQATNASRTETYGLLVPSYRRRSLRSWIFQYLEFLR